VAVVATVALLARLQPEKRASEGERIIPDLRRRQKHAGKHLQRVCMLHKLLVA
jgi:hypothetical protein